jgi:hypothetical protein
MPTGQYQQPQATGYAPSPTGVYQPNNQSIPARFSSPSQPIQFNPLPPSASTSTPSPTGSSATAQFQPSNVFASMKQGGLLNANSPQESSQSSLLFDLVTCITNVCSSDKYDALRAQPTGMGGFNPQSNFQQQQQQPLMPQQTGFPGMMQPQQYQPQQQQQQPQQQYPQQTGYNNFNQQQRQVSL